MYLSCRVALILLLLGFGVPAVGAESSESSGPSKAGSYPYCLVTHYTQNGFHYGRLAAQNHAKYAQKHGYGQQSFVGRLSGDAFVDPTQGDLNDLWGGGLFWQKLVAIEQVLRNGVATPWGGQQACAWVMWLDSDAVVTNHQTRLEDVLAPYLDALSPSWSGHVQKAIPVDVILAQETDHPINSGVFFVRNSPVGRSLIAALLALYPMYKDNNLPDQTALATLAYLVEPWPSSSANIGVNPSLHPSVRVAPQRTFDAFYQPHRAWPAEVQWQVGDFVAHLAGTEWAQREQIIRQLLADLGLFADDVD